MNKLLLGSLLALMVTTPAQAFLKAKAKTTVDDFDGTTRVSITHGALSCQGSQSLSCPMIGFSWASSLPNELFIHTQMADLWTKQYYSIKQLQISVDGEIKTFDGIGTTDYRNDSVGTYSDQGFLVPIELLETFKTNKNIKMRLVTDKGYYNGVFTGGNKQSIAEKHFILFNTELEKQSIR